MYTEKCRVWQRLTNTFVNGEPMALFAELAGDLERQLAWLRYVLPALPPCNFAVWMGRSILQGEVLVIRVVGDANVQYIYCVCMAILYVCRRGSLTESWGVITLTTGGFSP
jgi:hypothetical protein